MAMIGGERMSDAALATMWLKYIPGVTSRLITGAAKGTTFLVGG